MSEHTDGTSDRETGSRDDPVESGLLEDEEPTGNGDEEPEPRR